MDASDYPVAATFDKNTATSMQLEGSRSLVWVRVVEQQPPTEERCEHCGKPVEVVGHSRLGGDLIRCGCTAPTQGNEWDPATVDAVVELADSAEFILSGEGTQYNEDPDGKALAAILAERHWPGHSNLHLRRLERKLAAALQSLGRFKGAARDTQLAEEEERTVYWNRRWFEACKQLEEARHVGDGLADALEEARRCEWAYSVEVEREAIIANAEEWITKAHELGWGAARDTGGRAPVEPLDREQSGASEP